MCMDNLLFNDGAGTESVRVICDSPVMREMIRRVLSPRFTLTDKDASFTVVCTEGEPPAFRGPGIIIGNTYGGVSQENEDGSGTVKDSSDKDGAGTESGADSIAAGAEGSAAKRCKRSADRSAERIYLPRPLDISLLMGAAQSLTKKTVRHMPGGYKADSTRRTVSVGAREAALTKTEFELFTLLGERLGEPVSREEIERRLWNGEVGGTACGVYISYLRKKLAPLAGNGAVVSVRKKGYMLCPPALGE